MQIKCSVVHRPSCLARRRPAGTRSTRHHSQSATASRTAQTIYSTTTRIIIIIINNSTIVVWYGILGFNVPFVTVQVISETGYNSSSSSGSGSGSAVVVVP